MSVVDHSEWLSLIDVSGPFLAEPVLKEAFPQGLEGLEATKKTLVRQAYDEWREALDLDDPDLPKIHRAWIDLVLKRVLELDENGDGDVLRTGDALSHTLRWVSPEHGIAVAPDYALVDERVEGPPLLLIGVYEPFLSLTEPLKSDAWAASPSERMVELCRATGTRLGLVTNGEQWLFVDAPVGGVTTFVTWYGRLWGPEPVTLRAFVSLFGVRRFFVDQSEQLPALLDRSLTLQDEVTDALGEQVRRAVEVLIQALDRADLDRDRELLKGVEPAELYEAGLTFMMRIVFLLSAEERGLLLLGDERYETNYAVSSLRIQLRQESEEILERRWDAWSRLLSIFRAVYGGIEHEAMRLPALGGSLFDPDRFPFLEGRTKGSRWRTDAAAPLPVDNRTVLYLLDAVQLFHGRTLSYRALDVEQIGYVYEGLLERTVARAEEVTLDLDATRSAKRPWASLAELNAAAAEGREILVELLKDRTGSSIGRVRNDLDKTCDDGEAERLLTACQGDRSLRDRLRPFVHLLRTDRWGYPLVYPTGTFMVTGGADRRETGSHYTPKQFTEAIVKETLEPLVYIGPAENEPRTDWNLRSPAEILELKICDPAMGSGAFLVQVCRWLSERLVEAWAQAQAAGNGITSDGEVVAAIGSREPLRDDGEERLLTARRLIAERCLYGVDMNPLAIELAKLSIWLVTLSYGRPFGFLDHNLRHGDSLLGINGLDQLDYLDLCPDDRSIKGLFAAEVDRAVKQAVELRVDLRSRPIHDIRDVETMSRLDEAARRKLILPTLAADVLIGGTLAAQGRQVDATELAIPVGNAMAGDEVAFEELSRRATQALGGTNPIDGKVKRPFHWPLEFPEVFSRENGGFDAFVGNPPFLGGQMVSGVFGPSYHAYLVERLTYDEKSSVDLVVYFFLRVYKLLRDGGSMGLLARRSISEGRNRETGLSQLLAHGARIYNAVTNIRWPGKASVVIHQIHVFKGNWQGVRRLNREIVPTIAADLGDSEFWEPKKLRESLGLAFQGTILAGEGFKISASVADQMISASSENVDVLYPFVGGNEVNKDPLCRPSCWVVNFWDWPESRARSYKDAFSVVESKVKPVRQRKSPNGQYVLRSPLPQRWWLHEKNRPALFRAMGRGNHLANERLESPKRTETTLDRVIVISTGVTKFPAFTFLPSNYVFSNKLCVVCSESYSIYSVLSSDVHGLWAWAQKTSLGGDLFSLVYAHGNIFGTFPFPTGILQRGDDNLDRLGEHFFKKRQAYMEGRRKGLTKFYNDFHDQTKNDAELKAIRHLQAEMNDAVCQSYGWGDIDLSCGFHQVGYLPEGNNTRFTISEAARLALLSLLSRENKDRFEEQCRTDCAFDFESFDEAETAADTFQVGLFATEGSDT
jgi:hypothetical protein